jgi:hypothetical protein
VEEGEEEVDDVDGREEDVDDEIAGMKILVPEYRHDRDLEKNRFQNQFKQVWCWFVTSSKTVCFGAG